MGKKPRLTLYLTLGLFSLRINRSAFGGFAMASICTQVNKVFNRSPRNWGASAFVKYKI